MATSSLNNNVLKMTVFSGSQGKIKFWNILMHLNNTVLRTLFTNRKSSSEECNLIIRDRNFESVFNERSEVECSKTKIKTHLRFQKLFSRTSSP